MKKYTVAFLFIVSASFLIVAASASPRDLSTQKATKVHSGEVVSIDASKNELVIKDSDGTEAHVMISSSTRITREGKVISLADVKAGDTITCECEDAEIFVRKSAGR